MSHDLTHLPQTEQVCPKCKPIVDQLLEENESLRKASTTIREFFDKESVIQKENERLQSELGTLDAEIIVLKGQKAEAGQEIERLKDSNEHLLKNLEDFYKERDHLHLVIAAAEDVAHYYGDVETTKEDTDKQIQERLAELKASKVELEYYFYNENSNGEMMTREENEKRLSELKEEKK